MSWGYGSGPLVPLEGRLTANQYKVALSDHLYPVVKHLYPAGNGLLSDHHVPFRGLDWIVWWVWKWSESYTIAVAVTWSQPSWTPVGDFGLTTLSTIVIETPKYWTPSGRMVIRPSSRVPRPYRINLNVHWSCFGWHVVTQSGGLSF